MYLKSAVNSSVREFVPIYDRFGVEMRSAVAQSVVTFLPRNFNRETILETKRPSDVYISNISEAGECVKIKVHVL